MKKIKFKIKRTTPKGMELLQDEIRIIDPSTNKFIIVQLFKKEDESKIEVIADDMFISYAYRNE